MAEKMKPIYSNYLTELKPIIWYGEVLYTRYRQLSSILKERLGEEYAYFLAEPSISTEAMQGKAKALWFSDYVHNAKPFSALSDRQQQKVGVRLKQIIEQVTWLAKKLQTEENIQSKQMGELLQLALEIPAMDYIYVEDDKICLVCWGFTSDKAQKNNFKLTKYIESLMPPPTPPTPPPPPPPAPPTEKDPAAEEPPKVSPAEPPPPVAAVKKEKKKRKFPWWWILLLLLLILLLALFITKRFSLLPLLPGQPGLAPIDSSKIIPRPDDPLKRQIVSNRLTVVLAAGSDLRQFARDFKKKYPENAVKFVGHDPELHLLQVEIPANQQEQWKKRFEEFPLVKYVLYDTLLTTEYIPNDPGFKDTDVKKFWGLLAVHVFGAWDVTRGNPGIVIAVIDSGFDLRHPELTGKSFKPWNIIAKTPGISGASAIMLHGTHVAATAAGVSDNGQGTGGICPHAMIMPVRIGDDNGNISTTSIYEAILYAARNGAHVANLSIGTNLGLDLSKLSPEQKESLMQLVYKLTQKEAQFWDEIYRYAAGKGLIIVQAAGNMNFFSDIDPMKRSPYTIIVAATDESGKKAGFSNYGSKTTLSAPGNNIYGPVPGGTYNYLSGTSMAAPIVAGGIALLKSVNPNLTFNQIVAVLKETGAPVIDPTGTAPVGPLIQLDLAVRKIEESPLSQPCPCQDQIDELRREIEALKGKSTGTAPEVSRPMVIPKEKPRDFKFAAGRWKSSHDLYNQRTMERIQLYFDISYNGNGKLTLVEENGSTCTAGIALAFEPNTLVIRQDQPAQCDKNREYMPYHFVCRSRDNGVAVCTATPKTGTGKTSAYFYLVKEE
ncbi:MAG: serine protease [Acidobacteriota bacterium]|nr:serine protease [Acidobacteriota bacterium]